MNTKITIFICLTLFIFSSCRIAKERPILTVPDGNKDRMLKELFSGTTGKPKYWLSKVTIVDSSFEGGPGFVSSQSEAKLGYFEFTRDKLKFNNAVTRQTFEKPGISRQGVRELINEWDIEHSEYRLAEVDGYTTNKEEENNYIPWNKKRYFTIDWSKADISEVNTFPYINYLQNIKCWIKKTSHVIDDSRKITPNYISFIVAVEYEQGSKCFTLKRYQQNNFVSTVYYKYSFKRENSLKNKDYSPYVYDGEQDPLLKKYGYFRTVLPSIADDNRDKNIFYMNRWNPNKKHVFYFGPGYPEEYKDIAHGVICHTNKILAKNKLNDYPLDGKCKKDGSIPAGKNETCSSGICFELRENTGQKLGDIRYSFFHILSKSSGILGYGPSDAHPATGEIVSGNVILNTYYLDFYLKYLLQDRWKRDWKKHYSEDGHQITSSKYKYDNSSLFLKMKQTLKENDHTLWTNTSKLVDETSEIRPDFEYLISQLTFGDPRWSYWTRGQNQQTDMKFDIDSIFEIMPKKIREQGQKIIQQIQTGENGRQNHERNTTVYPVEPVIAQLPSLLANGMTPEEIKKKILFNLALHEFGHVLGLRHNFYGSFDTRHFHKHSHDDKQPVLKSSSVMDYTIFKDEAAGPSHAEFGPYDEAALVYSYSNGEIDLSKEKNESYLFCTDHHRSLNFLCSAWDYGGTPSEVMMSLIENYEESYFIRNLRIGRAYWNTSYYPRYIFSTMWKLKKALMMWRTAFNHNHISKLLSQSLKSYKNEKINFISNQIQKDIRQAIKLNLAFYNSVLQQPESDRDWKSFYDEESGSIEKIGIFWDKLFSMYFLMGDEGFLYNPNYFLGSASFLTYIDQLGFRQMIEEIMENTLTVRVDMEPWFIGFGRYLYAQNASNYYNIAGGKNLLEKIAVYCYTPKGLKDRFGIDPYSYKVREDSPPDFLDTAVVNMERYIDQITDPYYKGSNEKLGITFFDENYYVASSHLNKYSFTIIDSMVRNIHAKGSSLRLAKQDVYEMFSLYNYFKKNTIPQTCDNGI